MVELGFKPKHFGSNSKVLAIVKVRLLFSHLSIHSFNTYVLTYYELSTKPRVQRYIKHGTVLVHMDPGIQWVTSLNLRPMYPMRIFVESRSGILLVGVEGP